MTASRTRAFALLLLTVWAAAAMGAEQVSVEASPQGTAVAIEARATIRASHALIWQTLTDYDHLGEFIPGMLTSHVIGRRDSATTVEQTGKAGFLFFTYPIEVTVESREEPPGFIGMRVLKGNVKQLDGGYRITRAGDRDDKYVLRWSGLIERPSVLPPLITVPLMRSNIADQFLGMVKEIERREAVQRQKQVARIE